MLIIFLLLLLFSNELVIILAQLTPSLEDIDHMIDEVSRAMSLNEDNVNKLKEDVYDIKKHIEKKNISQVINMVIFYFRNLK